GGSSGLVLTDALIAQMAGAATVSLRSASVIDLYGNAALGTAADPIGTLTLDAAGLYSDGAGSATVTATDLVLKDSQSSPSTANAAAGAGGGLSLDALDTLTFGAGSKTIGNVATLTATAGTEILFSGTGSLGAGAADVTLTAPFLVVDTSASQSLTTSGALTILPGAGGSLSLSSSVYGGSLTLTAGSIADSGTIIAQAGTVILEAKTGNITLSGDAAIEAPGTVILLSDQYEDTPGGTVKLISDDGNVSLGSGTTIAVSAAGSGYAGTIGIQANSGTVTLDGTLNGAAESNALGGSFILSANALSGSLPINSGFTTEFEVALSTGDITIASGQTLTSATVLLQTDGGWVRVLGTVDASGTSGGTISLYGTKGVDVEGSLLAIASSSTEAGGTVEIGTFGTPNGDGTTDPYGAYNATYGYENVSAANSGSIILGSSAVIDVTGGSEGGTVLIRAPLLENGTVNVNVVSGATIRGASSKTLEAYAVWSTTDSTSGAVHFDGIVDPAGWYSSGGILLAGSFTNASGTTVASWDGTNPSLSSATLTSTGTASSSTSGSTTTATTTAYQWDGTTLTTTSVTTTSVSNTVTNTVTTVTAVNASTTTTTVTTTTSSGTTTTPPSSSATGSTAYDTAVEDY
ncbi:MAG: hypothetical protein P4L83_09200, partial [Nevskia sp.]|nr:hypothetical protein [Nevskia sp.]